MCYLNTVSLKEHTALTLYISFLNVILLSTLQLFLMFLGTGFEVITLVRTHNTICVWKMYSLVHSYECSGRGDKLLQKHSQIKE
jgi:hypothetical protein